MLVGKHEVIAVAKRTHEVERRTNSHRKHLAAVIGNDARVMRIATGQKDDPVETALRTSSGYSTIWLP